MAVAKQALRSVTPSPGCGAGHNLGGEDDCLDFGDYPPTYLGKDCYR